MTKDIVYKYISSNRSAILKGYLELLKIPSISDTESVKAKYRRLF